MNNELEVKCKKAIKRIEGSGRSPKLVTIAGVWTEVRTTNLLNKSSNAAASILADCSLKMLPPPSRSK
jgi:hypothetical protein